MSGEVAGDAIEDAVYEVAVFGDASLIGHVFDSGNGGDSASGIWGIGRSHHGRYGIGG